MSNRIDSKRDFAQSTSKLPVMPPSNSSTAAAIPLARPVINPDAPPAQPVRKKRPSKEPTPVPTLPLADSAGPKLQWSTLNPNEHSSDSPFSLSRFSYVYGMPSWLVSFVIHLILLILLALLSFGAANGPQILSLEMADPDSVTDMQMFEVAVDFEDESLDESSDVLEESSMEEIMPESSVDAVKSLMADLKSGLPQQAGSESDDGDALELAQGDGKGVKFFGAGAQGTKFVFVIDCSGSMDDDYRWDVAKRELKYAIGSLTMKQKYFVFLYNSRTAYMNGKKPKLVPPNKWNRDKTFDWLDDQFPFGDTRPRDAMRSALGMKPDAIFLLSDGELKDNTVEYLRIYNRSQPGDEYNESRTQIPIHTIFLGNGFGEQTMKTIADQNSGTFTRARN